MEERKAHWYLKCLYFSSAPKTSLDELPLRRDLVHAVYVQVQELITTTLMKDFQDSLSRPSQTLANNVNLVTLET